MDRLLENIFKYGLLIATAPIWWPVLKALWNELQAAMWREGGLIGRPPTAHEIPMLEKRYAEFSSPLLNESLAEFKLREEREETARRDAKKVGGKTVPAADGRGGRGGGGAGGSGGPSRPGAGKRGGAGGVRTRTIRPAGGGGAGLGRRSGSATRPGGLARGKRGSGGSAGGLGRGRKRGF